jgi:predicted ferric reductase
MIGNVESYPTGPQGPVDPAELAPAVSIRTVLGLFLATMGGVAAALWVLPHWAPALAASLTGEAPKGYWYLARASGWVAFVLLWLSMAIGLLTTNRLARVWPGGPAAIELHEHFSLLALAFVLFHALVLLGDRYIGYSLAVLFVPFASRTYRPVYIACGQVAFYAAALVTVTYYVRRRIGARRWRLVHYLTFAVFLLALIHGLGSGTDSGAGVARAAYGLSGLSIVLLAAIRVTRGRRPIASRLGQACPDYPSR